MTRCASAPDPLVAAQMALLRVMHAADLPDPGSLAKKFEEMAASGAFAAPAPAQAGEGASAQAQPALNQAAAAGPDWQELIERIDAPGICGWRN